MAEKVGVHAKTPESKQKCSNSCKQNPSYNSSGPPADRILQLQRTAGNQAVQRLIKSRALQAKLKIGQSNDIYEQEADRVAEQVMRMPDPVSVPQSPVNSRLEGLSIQSATRYPEKDIQRKEDDDEEEGIVQMKQGSPIYAAGSQPDVPPIVHEVLSSPGFSLDPATRSHMGPRPGHDFSRIPLYPLVPGVIQTKLAINAPGDKYEQEADLIVDQVLAKPAHQVGSGAPLRIQRFPGQPAVQAGAAPASVDQALASSGRPLEPGLRQDMEERFGHDFSRVRVHTGAAAEQSARDVNAYAYTVGYDMVFGSGRLEPWSHEGRRLIAHELTHVVQQSASEVVSVSQGNGKYGLSNPSARTIQRRRANYNAGGCATCTSASAAGSLAHPYAQRLFVNTYGKEIVSEAPINNPYDDNGRLDLYRVDKSRKPWIVEFGEIKPDNDRGVANGRDDLDWYERQLIRIFEPPDFLVSRFDADAPSGTISFKDNARLACPLQVLSVRKAKIGGPRGLYLYRCDPPGRPPGPRLPQCCMDNRRRTGPEPEPPVIVEPLTEPTSETKQPSEPKGKGDGQPGKGNGQPSKGDGGRKPNQPGQKVPPEQQPTLHMPSSIDWPLVILALGIIASATPEGRIGMVLGLLLRRFGIAIAIAVGAATASAATPGSVGGPPTGKPIPLPVPVPSDTSSQPRRTTGAQEHKKQPTTGAPQQKAPKKAQAIEVVIEGVNLEHLSIGRILPIYFVEEGKKVEEGMAGFAILQVANKVTDGNDTTVEFNPLQQAPSLGGKTYTATSPHLGSKMPTLYGLLPSDYRIGSNPQWFWDYLENLSKNLEVEGRKIEANQIREEVQWQKLLWQKLQAEGAKP
jgi:hypothetical protein